MPSRKQVVFRHALIVFAQLRTALRISCAETVPRDKTPLGVALIRAAFATRAPVGLARTIAAGTVGAGLPVTACPGPRAALANAGSVANAPIAATIRVTLRVGRGLRPELARTLGARRRRRSPAA